MQIKYLPEKCIGCRLCEMACSGVKEGVFNPSLARLQVASRYKAYKLVNEAKICDSCQSCVRACSTGAIKFEEGRLVFVKDDCVKCGACFEACPTGVLRPGGDEFPLLCDGCQGDPYCVKWCPHGALILEEVG
ncbi:4Fe-4S dicluster domain-containing protein, partial [Desulfotruncus alcoholivorax]|uniref:4Fe-4S dicluster domain-containing protein n=1 Tax=Desulfotruncus alcoholivorax TaxID=265477 RepID=UPI0003F601BE